MGKVSNKKKSILKKKKKKKNLKAEKEINTSEGFHSNCKQVILIDSVYKNNEYYWPNMFLEKYLNKDIKINSNNSYSGESDEEYIGLFLETVRKIW